VIDPANDITAEVFGSDPVPHDLTALRADPVYGDGVYAGVPFGPWQFVRLGDGTQAAWSSPTASWSAGAAPPVAPADQGEIVADLATLKRWLGSPSDLDDELLTDSLSAATAHWYERCCDWAHPDVQQAIVMTAAGIYSARRSPEGVAGFGGEGAVVRVVAADPRIRALVERHLDMGTVGVG
jgi:hypothetical protein